MGGCASRPKGIDLNPTEVPATPKNKAEPEIVGGESQKEDASPPLLDLSDQPKQEAPAGGHSDSTSAPSKPAEPEPVSVPVPEPAQAHVPDLTSQLTTQAEKVEAIAKELEDKTEATVQTQTKDKEGHLKSDLTPTSEDKTTVAPLVAAQA